MNTPNENTTVMWTGWCSKCETRFPFSASKESPHPHKGCPRCSTTLGELKEFGRSPVEAAVPVTEIENEPTPLDFDDLV